MDVSTASSALKISSQMKRKLDSSNDRPPHWEDVTTVNESKAHVAKRARRDGRDENPSTNLFGRIGVVDLPPQILQHIFSFVPPITLGHLLCVCRKFNALLDPSKVAPAESSEPTALLVRKQDAIWTRSRRLNLPGWPKPLTNLTELGMLRLLRVRRCQFCGRAARPAPSYLSNVPWSAGPGREDVRTIWPFRIRSCGTCLEARLKKESQLMLSGSSMILPGLPFAVLTPSFNYVTSVALHQQDPPPELRLTKYYYAPDIEALENQLVEVQMLGKAATQEWYKGLHSSGKEKRDDAERLEQWETSFAARLLIKPNPVLRGPLVKPPSPSLPSTVSVQTRPLTHAYSNDASLTSPSKPFSEGSSQYSGRAPSSSFRQNPDMPLPMWTPAPGQTTSQYATSVTGSDQPARSRRSKAKTPPTAEQLTVLQSEKRAAIEKRCRQIDPPIRASVLPFMEAFRTALLVPLPLNDSSWDHLKGKLLTQRAEAEQKERNYLAQQQNLQFGNQDRASGLVHSLGFHGHDASAWAELGLPARQKLKDYADDYIASDWAGGVDVTSESAARFATDVIVEVKKRFDAGVVEEDRELASRGMVLPHDSDIHQIRRLKLEDMKWLYDESVRPHTARFGNELFSCRGCDHSMKRLAFEGLIQHYGAKHTSDFGRGNATVYWKAPWPETMPFVTVDAADRMEDLISDRGPDTVANEHQGSRSQPQQYSSPPPSLYTSLNDRPSRPRRLYEEHQDEVIHAVRAAFYDTEGVRALPDSVRLYVIIHLIVRSFSRAFNGLLPSIALFADCVKSGSFLRDLRDLHGLRCHSCILDLRSSSYDMPEYWLSQLLDHFQNVHVGTGGFTTQERSRQPIEPEGLSRQPVIDWVYDMVELPHPQIIRNLAPELNDRQFNILTGIFPELFDNASSGNARLLQQEVQNPAEFNNRGGPRYSHSEPHHRHRDVDSLDLQYRQMPVQRVFVDGQRYFSGTVQYVPVECPRFSGDGLRAGHEMQRATPSPPLRGTSNLRTMSRASRTMNASIPLLEPSSILEEDVDTRTEAEKFLDNFDPLSERYASSQALSGRPRGVFDHRPSQAASSSRVSRTGAPDSKHTNRTDIRVPHSMGRSSTLSAHPASPALKRVEPITYSPDFDWAAHAQSAHLPNSYAVREKMRADERRPRSRSPVFEHPNQRFTGVSSSTVDADRPYDPPGLTRMTVPFGESVHDVAMGQPRFIERDGIRYYGETVDAANHQPAHFYSPTLSYDNPSRSAYSDEWDRIRYSPQQRRAQTVYIREKPYNRRQDDYDERYTQR